MTAESVATEVHDPAAWLVVLLSVLIVACALGLIVAGLVATDALPFTAGVTCACTAPAG